MARAPAETRKKILSQGVRAMSVPDVLNGIEQTLLDDPIQRLRVGVSLQQVRHVLTACVFDNFSHLRVAELSLTFEVRGDDARQGEHPG